jgi:hypothetical protein
MEIPPTPANNSPAEEAFTSSCRTSTERSSMKKLMLLALVVASAAMFAIPSVAAAGEWTMDCPGGAEKCEFTTKGEAAELRAESEPTIKCTASTGTGSVTSATTGTFGITFTGCTANLGFLHPECHTTGSSSGVIAVATSTSHNVYLEPNKSTPGLLVTPATTELICAGFSNITVTGNGLIGHIRELKTGESNCGKESSTWTVDFKADSANANTQDWEQVTTTGTFYDLHMVTAGSATTHTSTMVASGTITFPSGKAKITCT